MKKGKIILIFGISAVGKTYYKELLAKKFNLYKLKRVITREKRSNEKFSTDIYIKREEFEYQNKEKNFFIDIEINGEYYGYLNSDFNKINEGLNIIGDCYYKLFKKLKLMLGNNLKIICIQPKDIEYNKKLIRKERVDYKKRIEDSILEYEFFEKNKQYIDYLIYTEYNRETDIQIINCVDEILKGA